MRGGCLVPIKTRHARTTLPPALGPSHERLICTMQQAVSHAAMCSQDPPAMRIVYRSLCRGSTLLITSHGTMVTSPTSCSTTQHCARKPCTAERRHGAHDHTARDEYSSN
jgi:hypothetical protein